MSTGKGIGFGVGMVLGGCGTLILLVLGGWWLLSAGNARVETARAERLELLVKQHKVEIEMTEDQVRRALGEPKLIDRSRPDGERWLYPGHKPILMKNGKVWLVEQ